MQVQAAFQDRLLIQKIDVDDSKDLSSNFRVMSVPVLILFKNGEPVWRMNALTAPELVKIIEKLVNA